VDSGTAARTTAPAPVIGPPALSATLDVRFTQKRTHRPTERNAATYSLVYSVSGANDKRGTQILKFIAGFVVGLAIMAGATLAIMYTGSVEARIGSATTTKRIGGYAVKAITAVHADEI
jgi:hypothetical protein